MSSGGLVFLGAIEQAVGVGHGVAELSTSATDDSLAAVTGDAGALALDADGVSGYWLHAEVALRSVSDIAAVLGFNSAALTHVAWIAFDTDVDSTRWRFSTRGGGSVTTANMPEATAPAADTFQRFDVILTPDFAAAWVDGDGPYPSTTNLPTDDVTPAVGVFTRTSSSKSIRIDQVRVRAIYGAVVAPALLGIT